MEKQIFDQPYLSVFFEEEKSMIHLRWKKLASPDEYRTGLEFALEMVKTHHIRLWLANLREMSVIREAERNWTNETWFPKLTQTSLKKLAIINSMDYFNQSSVSKIMNRAQPILSFETRYFNDLDEARNWLLAE